MEGFKFQIGEIVRHKLSKRNRLLISEQYAHIHDGGRENSYMCALGFGEGSFSPTDFDPEKRFRICEIELERVE